MKISFVNRGLLNLIEPLGINESDIKDIRIGESMFIIRTKSGVMATVDYKIEQVVV